MFEILDWNNTKTDLIFSDIATAIRTAEARSAQTGNIVKLVDLETQQVRNCSRFGWEKHWHSCAAPSLKEDVAHAIDEIEDR